MPRMLLPQFLTHHGAQVSRAAARALRHVSFYGGLGGTLRSLIASQSDYVIDALCMRLRHLEVSASRAQRGKHYLTCTLQAHPSAARMFAAVLQRADGAHTLLPFLLEPLRYTVLALSGAHVQRLDALKCRARELTMQRCAQ